MHGQTGVCTVEPVSNIDANPENMNQQVDSTNAGKMLPRRNKKRRPPGYYEKLEAQQHIPSQTASIATTSETTHNCAPRTMNSEQIYVASNNDIRVLSTETVPTISRSDCESYQTSDLAAVDGQNVYPPYTQSGSLQKESVINYTIQHDANSSIMSNAGNSSHKGSQIIASQTTSHPIEIVTSLSDSQTSNVIATAKADNEDRSHASDALPVQVDSSNKTLHSSASSEQAPASAPVQSHTETRQQQTQSQTQSSGVTESERFVAEDSSNVSPAEETAAVEPAPAVAEPAEESQAVVPEQPKKPASWAGLFSGTKQAKAATVIYTGDLSI